MTTVTTKARLVRCPKCRKVLPELEDLPVYECGGCGAVLQAKNRKASMNSNIPEKDPPVHKNELMHGSEDGDLARTNQEAFLSSAEECSSHLTTGSEQIESEDYSKMRSKSTKSSNEVVSGELDSHKKEESLSETGGNKQMEESQKSTHHGFDRVMETTEPINLGLGFISEDTCDTPREKFSKSPTKSSYAYDGSVSSYDGWDDQVSDQYPHIPRTLDNSQRVRDFVSTRGGRPPRGDISISNNSLKHGVKRFSSMSLHEKNGFTGSSNVNSRLNELPESSTYENPVQGEVKPQDSESFNPVQNWLELQRGEILSRQPFYKREIGSSSTHLNEDFPQSSTLYSSEKLDNYEQMKLLKKMDELRDQLNRSSYAQKGKANGGGYISSIDIRREKTYDATCHQHHSRLGEYGPRNISTQNSDFPQLSFSGQATNCKSHVDCSCLHCYKDNYWRYPVQPPPTIMRYNTGLSRGHFRHMCYNPYSSSGPQPYRELKLPQESLNTQLLHNQRYMESEVKKSYHGERYESAKRHFRPISGGAPFVICYRCRKLLQLPADFLISRKRCHKLKCGACSKLLMFSLQNRSRIVPYASNLIQPRPSEASNDSHLINSSVASAPYANNYSLGNPVSFSEDYGGSLSKSCSTDAEPAFQIPPFPVRQGTAIEKMHPLNGYSHLEKKKSVFKYKNPVDSSESATSSTNMAKPKKLLLSFEASNETPIGPALHKLMGYFSASELIYASAGETNSESDEE